MLLSSVPALEVELQAQKDKAKIELKCLIGVCKRVGDFLRNLLPFKQEKQHV